MWKSSANRWEDRGVRALMALRVAGGMRGVECRRQKLGWGREGWRLEGSWREVCCTDSHVGPWGDHVKDGVSLSVDQGRGRLDVGWDG